MDATNKIFNETKKAINHYDEFQKNNSIVSNLYRNKFNNFVSTLCQLGIKLQNNVGEQYFRGDSDKEVMDQIEKLNMNEENKQYLKETCQYYKEKHTVPKENKIKDSDFDPLRKHINVEEVFTPRFKCLILICKNKIYSEIQNDAKQLLGQIVAELKNKGLIFNDKIKDGIDKGIIEKYGSVVSKFYEDNKSKINAILFKAAQIKNEHEVKTILKQLEYQDKIKAEKEPKKQKGQERQNNKPKDKSKTEKNDNSKAKNKNEKTSKKNNIGTKDKIDGNKDNNKQKKSDKKSFSVQGQTNNEVKNKNPEIKLEQQKEIEKPNKIDKQRIHEVAESSYFHEMLWNSFDHYRNHNTKQSIEQANIYQEFRNLSMVFANSIKTKYNTGTNLMVIENFQNEEINTFLVKYLLDDKFNKFKFEAKPREYKGITGVNVANTTNSAIGYFAQEKIEQIATKSRPLIFNHPDYQKIAGAINGPGGNDDCFILAILSHLSSQKVEEIKKFVDKNKKRKLYIKNDKEEIEERTYDLFDLAGGSNLFNREKETISYMRAALAITIVDNWNRFPDGDPNRKLDIEDWNEFRALLGQGQRQISGETHMIAQAVANLTKQPYLLIYQSQVGQTGYFLATTDAITHNEIKTYNGVKIGDFKFDAIYSDYVDKKGLNAQQSKCIEESNKILIELNEKLLKLIDDPNVISIRLNASGNLKTGNTNGHFWAIGRNYTGEILTKQKNDDVFNRFKVEENFQGNADLNQLGFTATNKNMPSLYFLANENNIRGLEDIIDFLRRLDPKNIKANFDKWFKNILCSANGKIDENDENNFKNQIIKLFYSRNENNKLYKDGNKVRGWHEVIKNFSSCVPSQFHFKWFQIVYQLWPDPILFYTNTVIGKLANIKLENDNGMKYFGYLIGKFVEAVAGKENVNEAYKAWKKKFIDGDYLENILTCKNDLENDFLSEVKDKKFIDYNNQNIVDDLFKFIKLFDPSDLYVLIGVVKKEQNCDALKPLYNLSPKTVNKFCNLFRNFVSQKGKNQNEINKEGDKKENKNDNIIKKQDDIRNAHINLIKLLGEINSQNPNGIFDQIISDSKSFEELRDSLKTIKSIVAQGNGAKNFLFNLDFESFKKVLDFFKPEKEKKENNKEEEKKENNQQSLWDFIKDKNYKRDDIQKIVSVSNSLDEIKNNIKSLDDTLKIDQCKTCQQKNKTGFWDLFTSIRNHISKIFSLFKNNGNQDLQDKQSLEYIASALNKDGDEGETARVLFYTMSKNMGQEKMKQLWEQVEKYMAKNKENKENNEKPKEEEITTSTK